MSVDNFTESLFLWQIEISRTYGTTEWREDMKKLLKHDGCSGKQTVFLFADSQMKEENFVEDINLLLITGDIKNLFPGDDKAQILEKVQGSNEELEKKMETNAFTLFTYFVERVKANLHIALAMSHVGDAFRNRLRMFPSLINYCTIEWYVQPI
jgi:dynein heavy chain